LSTSPAESTPIRFPSYPIPSHPKILTPRFSPPYFHRLGPPYVLAAASRSDPCKTRTYLPRNSASACTYSSGTFPLCESKGASVSANFPTNCTYLIYAIEQKRNVPEHTQSTQHKSYTYLGRAKAPTDPRLDLRSILASRRSEKDLRQSVLLFSGVAFGF
jgi:hypothetical protein